jgi:citrate lyase subunit beta / citryl-CoA lyase
MSSPPQVTASDAPLLLRSMLFVPGDSEKKLAKSESVDADALILDLEDSVDPARKPQARALVADFLRQNRSRHSSVWVRINALWERDGEEDLAGIAPAQPAGIVLPKSRSADDLLQLGRRLDELEERFGIARGSTRIMPIATETPEAIFNLGGYVGLGPRLAAVTWGAEDLRVAIGASTNVDEHGKWLPPYELARSLCLLAAAAARAQAIDTVFTDLRDERGLSRQAAAAQRDGFTGKLAIHPEQVEILNRTFQPGPDVVAHARRVVEAFKAGGSGVVALDGKMLDQPHLQHAQRILALASRFDASRS